MECLFGVNNFQNFALYKLIDLFTNVKSLCRIGCQVEKDARSDTEEELDDLESDSELSAPNGLGAGDHVTKRTAANHSD